MNGENLSGADETANEMAEEYRRLMIDDDELDEFFVEEDLGGQLETGEVEPEMAERVFKKLGIDKPIDN